MLSKLLRSALGPGAVDGLGERRMVGNVPAFEIDDEQALFGAKVPRSELLKARPPINGATGVVGPQGSGKTLFAMRQGAVWQSRGARLITNREVTHQDDMIEGLHDVARLIEVQETTPTEDRQWICLVLDEVGIDADARDWASFPRSLAHAMTQVRKYRLNLIWTAVYAERVDILLRDYTGFVWECNMSEPIPFPVVRNFTGGVIVSKCWPPSPGEERGDEQPIREVRFRPRRQDLDRFDSWAIHRNVSESAVDDELRRARADKKRQKELAALSKLASEPGS